MKPCRCLGSRRTARYLPPHRESCSVVSEISLRLSGDGRTRRAAEQLVSDSESERKKHDSPCLGSLSKRVVISTVGDSISDLEVEDGAPPSPLRLSRTISVALGRNPREFHI